MRRPARFVAAALAVALALALIPPAGPGAAAFGRSYALAVGLDDYSALGLAPLRYAERDAGKVAEYFRAQGYETTLLTGARASKRLLFEEVRRIARDLGKDDRFVFFFAGHGRSVKRDGLDVGYLVLNGGRSAQDQASLISAGDIGEISRRLEAARHQLFVFDSCYGGLLGQLPTRGGTEGVAYSSEEFLLRDLSARASRQFLSAGGDDQQVLDAGPAGLSWFTYFFMKALEPGVVNRRASGLITFSEFAAFVQAYSANLRHTPAFGSLSGHRGGDFLFYDTAKGDPRLAPLPDVRRSTLEALGFLTRGEDAEAVRGELSEMRGPIDRLYQAWRSLDLDLYLAQLDPAVRQTGVLRGGRRYERGYDEIVQRRRRDFARLERVEVPNYEVMYQGGDARTATFGVRYNMDFFYRDRPPIHERNVKECYLVRRGGDGRWRIVRNDDYQAQICARP